MSNIHVGAIRGQEMVVGTGDSGKTSFLDARSNDMQIVLLEETYVLFPATYIKVGERVHFATIALWRNRKFEICNGAEEDRGIKFEMSDLAVEQKARVVSARDMASMVSVSCNKVVTSRVEDATT